ncbi:MAG: hydrogenase maturation nickel metallochaperone HypA [Ktedonobacterales bacterium]
MHEVAAIQGICSVAVKQAQAAGAKKVTHIEMTLGASDHLSEEAVRQHFEVLANGTLAEGASLSITWLPATYQCFSCLSRFESAAQSGSVTCPSCSGTALEIAHEEVFYVTSIDVEFN